MSILKTLKLTAATRENPSHSFRTKILSYLDEQKALAEAELAGTTFTATKSIMRTDESGQKQHFELPRKVRKGWFTDAGGKLHFHIRYGAKPLELAKGLNAVQVPDLNDLPTIIATIIEATQAGELDPQITAAIAERRANFKPAGKGEIQAASG